MAPRAREGPELEEMKKKEGQTVERGRREDTGRRAEEEERTRRTEGKSDGKGARRNTRIKPNYAWPPHLKLTCGCPPVRTTCKPPGETNETSNTIQKNDIQL